MTTGIMQRATKGEIERDARELIEAMDREKITSPRSLNVRDALEVLRETLSRGRRN